MYIHTYLFEVITDDLTALPSSGSRERHGAGREYQIQCFTGLKRMNARECLASSEGSDFACKDERAPATLILGHCRGSWLQQVGY